MKPHFFFHPELCQLCLWLCLQKPDPVLGPEKRDERRMPLRRPPSTECPGPRQSRHAGNFGSTTNHTSSPGARHRQRDGPRHGIYPGPRTPHQGRDTHGTNYKQQTQKGTRTQTTGVRWALEQCPESRLLEAKAGAHQHPGHSPSEKQRAPRPCSFRANRTWPGAARGNGSPWLQAFSGPGTGYVICLYLYIFTYRQMEIDRCTHMQIVPSVAANWLSIDPLD